MTHAPNLRSQVPFRPTVSPTAAAVSVNRTVAAIVGRTVAAVTVGRAVVAAIVGRTLATIVPAVVLALVLAGCSSSKAADPGPTPATFTGIAASFRQQGILIQNVVSGEAGCTDAALMPEAISFDARGLDQTSSVRIHLYIFGNGSVYTRLRSLVDTCAKSYVKNPDDYTTVDVTPYVAAGVGPWAPQFKDHLRTALAQAVSPDSVGI